MKKQALNHRSYNAIIATSMLIGILLVGVVENIYQEAKAQSLNFNLPTINGYLPGLERGKIQFGKIISSILTGVSSPVQKTRLAILNKPPILSDAKREIIQDAEERTHLYGPPLPRSNQPIFGPLYQTQVRLAVLNQTGNSDIGLYHGQVKNNQGTSRLANNDTSNNNSSRCQSLPINAITNNAHYGINIAKNTLDHNYATYWSNLGRGSWIQADLGEEKVLCSLDIAWYRGNLRHNNFEVSVSNDGSTFTTVLADESSGTTRYFERYVLPQIAVARYVKIIVNGNSENNWASITEINLNGYSASGSTTTSSSTTPSSSSSLRSQEVLPHSQNNLSPTGGLQIFANKSVAVPRTSLSLANEPSLANKDNLIFYTGNWYDVRSLDGGSTWTYIDPFRDMHDFCCDQDIVYDSVHQIFIWYRLGTFDSNGENRFRLGISSDTSNWLFYNISPRNFNGTWSHQFWDYPQLALSNKYLYITSNMFDQSGKLLRTIISRWSLQDLSVGQSDVSFSYYSDKSLFNFTPVQGATDTMYWASHVSNSRMRIFRWSDTQSAITSYDREIPAWTSSSDVTMSCKGPDSNDWCGRADSRILGGWLSQGTIGFMWMASAGNGFPWPYLNAAKFRLSDMTYLESPYLWSPDHAWMYGSISPNSKEDLGIVAFYGGGKVNPSLAIGISENSINNNNNSNNDAAQLQSAWKMESVMRGTNDPSQNDWGDFLRIRPYSGSVVNWVASGYTLQGGSTEDFIEPVYLIFGPHVHTTTINSPLRESPSTVTPTGIKPQGGHNTLVLAVSSNSSGGSLPSIDNKKSKDIVDKRSTYYYHTLLYSPILERMSINPNNSSTTNDQVSSNYSSFTESKSDSWNLQGNIYFEGLNCNPKKTNITVPPCSGRYPNYEVMVASSKDCKTILSKTKSDQNGNYRMRLAPGNYVICPTSGNATTTPRPFGLEESKPIHFVIKEGRVTNLDLIIRTGIR